MSHKSILWVAAPMVKVSSLPFRLTCLNMGADMVYSDEIIGDQLCLATRKENTETNTIEFSNPCQKSPIFMTSPLEQDKVVLQLGVADSVSALKSALLVLNDVNHLDINMGCPKRFSVNKGMGAVLLSCPEIVEDILKTLKRNLPESTKISCKVRLKNRLQDTIDFIRCCEFSGADVVAIHTRYVRDSPAQPAQWNTFSTIKSSVHIPLYVNGDLLNSGSIQQFYKNYIHVHHELQYSCDTDSDILKSSIPNGLMLARGALWNPAIFGLKSYFSSPVYELDSSPPKIEPVEKSISRILFHAQNTSTLPSALKWLFLQMLLNEPRLALHRETVMRTPNLQKLATIFETRLENDGTFSQPLKKQRVESLIESGCPKPWHSTKMEETNPPFSV